MLPLFLLFSDLTLVYLHIRRVGSHDIIWHIAKSLGRLASRLAATNLMQEQTIESRGNRV